MKITEAQLRHGIRKMIREQLDSPYYDYSDETEEQRQMYDMGYRHGLINQVEQFPDDEDYLEGYAAGYAHEPVEEVTDSPGDDSLYGENPGRWLD